MGISCLAHDLGHTQVLCIEIPTSRQRHCHHGNVRQRALLETRLRYSPPRMSTNFGLGSFDQGIGSQLCSIVCAFVAGSPTTTKQQYHALNHSLVVHSSQHLPALFICMVMT